jgi:hypothetical protein
VGKNDGGKMKSFFVVVDKNDVPVGLANGKYEMFYAFNTEKLAEEHKEKGQKVVECAPKKGK